MLPELVRQLRSARVPAHVQSTMDTLQASSLIPFLAHEIGIASFHDMCQRYVALVCMKIPLHFAQGRVLHHGAQMHHAAGAPVHDGLAQRCGGASRVCSMSLSSQVASCQQSTSSTSRQTCISRLSTPRQRMPTWTKTRPLRWRCWCNDCTSGVQLAHYFFQHA